VTLSVQEFVTSSSRVASIVALTSAATLIQTWVELVILKVNTAAQ
jgi:hypothetical protein